MGVAFAPSGAYAYVVNHLVNQSVSIVNVATNTITRTISGFSSPEGVAISPSGSYAYVTNYNPGTISIVNIATNTITGAISGFDTPAAVVATAKCSTWS